MEIKTGNIEELTVKSKIVEETEKGEVVNRYPVTVVQFQVRGLPGQFDDLIRAVSHDQPTKAVFTSPQASFDIDASMGEAVPAAKL